MCTTVADLHRAVGGRGDVGGVDNSGGELHGVSDRASSGRRKWIDGLGAHEVLW